MSNSLSIVLEFEKVWEDFVGAVTQLVECEIPINRRLIRTISKSSVQVGPASLFLQSLPT